MVDENNINEALKTMNQNMLLNKKRIDIDKIVENILLFFDVHFKPLSVKVKNQIKEIKNIDENDNSIDNINGLVDKFFELLEKEIRKNISSEFENVKNNVGSLSDNECIKELSNLSTVIVNEISDFYLTNANDLVNELNKGCEEDKRISNYLLQFIYHRLINTLKDHFMFSIKVVDNNSQENNKKMESINEKTLNRV